MMTFASFAARAVCAALLFGSTIAQAQSSGAVDECAVVKDCAGEIDVDLTKSCTSDFGVLDSSLNGIAIRACLKCTEGPYSIDVNTYPYFVCNGKPLCGTAKGVPIDLKFAPKQLLCLWTNKENPSSCLQCGSKAADLAPTTAEPTSAPLRADVGDCAADSAFADDVTQCSQGEMPVSVEGVGTYCAKMPVCSGGFPAGNCPSAQKGLEKGAFCGTVRTKVPGCKAINS